MPACTSQGRAQATPLWVPVLLGLGIPSPYFFFFFPPKLIPLESPIYQTLLTWLTVRLNAVQEVKCKCLIIVKYILTMDNLNHCIQFKFIN